MPEAYTVLGAGRWGGILAGILEGMGRRVAVIGGIRRVDGESIEDHADRVAGRIPEWATAIWIAVPPGPHSLDLARLALRTGRHVVLEKPWPGNLEESRAIEALANAQDRRIAVHHQFPLLSAIEAAADRLNHGRGHVFEASFTLARASRNGIPPLPNLGSHLLAIRRRAFPESTLGPLSVGYQCGDARTVRIGPETIDFTRNDEPLIQRFIEHFEDPAGSVISPVEAAGIGAALRSLRRRPTDPSSPNVEVWTYVEGLEAR